MSKSLGILLRTARLTQIQNHGDRHAERVKRKLVRKPAAQLGWLVPKKALNLKHGVNLRKTEEQEEVENAIAWQRLIEIPTKFRQQGRERG